MYKLIRTFVFTISIVLGSQMIVLSQVHQDWAISYNGTANLEDEAHGIAVDNFGFVYVTGQSTNVNATGNSKDVATVRYNPPGTIQQIRTFNGIFQNSWDAGNAVALDRSGNVYVAGFTQKNTLDFDFLTMKYNIEDTNSIWGNTYDGYQRYDEAIKTLTDDSGNVYVLGNSYDNNVDPNVYMVVLKYNTLGILKWVKKYKGLYQAFGKAIALDNSGNVYAAGITKDFNNSDFNYVTIKYNAYNGDSLWAQIYNAHPLSPGNDIASSIVADNSGNVYVTGSSDSLSSPDYLTIKYGPSGNSAWIKRYNGSANDTDAATCIVINSLGNVCVSGYSNESGTGFDYATVCYDPSGVQQWVSIYNGSSQPGADGTTTDRVYAAGVDNFGNVYLTGVSTVKRSTSDYVTIKLSSSGNLLWETGFNITGSIIRNPSLAVDQMTNVCIAGSSNTDYITIKYSQAPNPPSDLLLTPLGNGKIRLNWTDNSPNETSFKILKKNDIDTNWIIKDSVAANTTQWQDSSLIPGRTYYYTVYAGNIAGNSAHSDTVNTIITNITNNLQIPGYFKLYQNHPNPFNPVTKIKFDIPDSPYPLETKLIIYDISGKKIITLVSQEINSGSYEVQWDAANYSSGIYYYTIKAGKFQATRKMLLLK